MSNILQRSWNQLISENTNSGLQQSSEQGSLRFSNPLSSKSTGVGKFDLRFNNSTANNSTANNGVGKFDLRFDNPGVGNTQTPKQGGNIDTQGILNMAQGAVDIIGGGINDFKISDYTPIQYGQYNSLESLNAIAGNTQHLNLEGNNVAGGFVSGTLSGASAGAMFGPAGMLIGAGVGGISRLLTGIFGNNKKKEEEEKRYKEAFGGLMAQNQNIVTSEINRNIWNDFKNGGLINNVFESGGFMNNSSGNKGNKYSAYPGMVAGGLAPGTPAPLEESDKGYEDMSLEDLARERRDLLDSSSVLFHRPNRDTSERITLSKGNNKSAKFINQNKVSKDAIHQIDSLSKEYNLDPHELLASLLIENSGYTDITTHAYYNTRDLVTKRFEKNRISTDHFLIFPDEGDDPVYEFPTDYKKMAKELGILQKDGSYNENVLKDRLRKNIEDIGNVVKQNKAPISGLDAHALFLKEFGYDAVNPKQQVLPGVKNDYVTMIKDGAEGLRREYADMFKNRGQGEESANSYKNGGLIKNNLFNIPIDNKFETGGSLNDNRFLNRLRNEIYTRVKPTDYLKDQAYTSVLKGVPQKRVDDMKELETVYKRLTDLENKKNRTAKEEEELNILVGTKERISGDYVTVQDEDAYRHYLGFDQIDNSIVDSKYRPTKGDPNINYKTLRFSDDQKQTIKDIARELERTGVKYPAVANMGSLTALENATLDRGWDEQGEYISIYDKYDMAPNKKGIIAKGLRKAENIVANPYEIYDRVYLNNKPVPEDFKGYGHINMYSSKDLYDIDPAYSGVDIKKLQNSLNYAGKNVAVDGDYGEETIKALDEYKKEYTKQLNSTKRSKNLRTNNFKFGGLIGNNFESGGQMTNGGVFSNNVNIVKAGGTHEENKYGGIPVSVDQEGKPNLIEEGEVVWNDYVFSNSLNLEEDLREGSNLPKGYAGKSFARIAEDIQKESEERPYNPISRRGLEDGLGKLIIAQELEKLRQDEDNLFQLMGEDANVFEEGGDMNRSTTEGNTNSAIDDLIALLDANLSEDDPIKELYLSYIDAGIDNVDMVKMLVGQDILESGGKPHNNNWGNITAGSNYKGKKVRRGDRDAEGNPIEQDFRTYDSTKDYVKDKVSLLERLYDFNKNDSAEVLAGKLTGNNKGGYKYATDPEYANKLTRMWGGDTSVRSGSYVEQSTSPSENTSVASNRTFSPERITGISELPPTLSRYSTNGQSADASAQKGEEDPEKENPGEENPGEDELSGFTKLLSIAPIIGNMAGYAESLFKKPEITQFDRVSPTPVNERLNYEPVNSAYASDILQNQYAGTRRSIMDSTGGNRGVAQTALLTNDRNMAEALYGAAYQGEQINFARNAQVQEFNAKVNQFNSQQDLQSQMMNSRINMEEVIANEQNRAALENDRQIRRNTVLENLGGLAQQLRWEKLAPIISGGYDQYGRKVKNNG